MWDVVFASLLVYGFFACIGIGPALFLFRNAGDLSISTAPTIGLVIVTVAGTILVSQDCPVAVWGNVLLVSCIAVSSVMAFYSVRYNKQNTMQKSLLPYFIGLVICTALIFAPIIIGGLTFTVLRGNGSDTFNYLTMAGSLIHESLSWLSSSPTEILVSRHPNYSLYSYLANTRWSSAMVMGWAAFVSHIPLYRFEFAFSAIFFVMSYSAAYCFGRLVPIRQRYAVLVALAMSVGFFGQYVLDIRALSQILSVPILLFLAVLIIYFHQNKDGPGITAKVLMGLGFASSIMHYIEILPTMILGFCLFSLMQIARQKESFVSLIRQYWLTLVITLITLLPVFHYLVAFFVTQIHYATSGKNHWEEAFFSWLYQDFPAGFWGLSIIHNDTTLMHSVWIDRGVTLISFILTGLLAYMMTYTLFSRNKNMPAGLLLSISILLAVFGQVGYLLLQQQYWAAGKTFTFGYPFIFLAVVSLFAIQEMIPTRLLLKLCKFSVAGWLVIQCCLGYYRITTAENHTLYPNYISHHGLYRQHQWNVDNITNAIKSNHIQSLGLNVHDVWLTEYLGQALGWEVHVTNLNGMPDRSGYVTPGTSLKSQPDYFVVAANSPQTSHAEIIARDPEFVLIKTSSLE